MNYTRIIFLLCSMYGYVCAGNHQDITVHHEPLYCCLQESPYIIDACTVLARGLYSDHNTTEIVFDSLFPVSGPLILHGGIIHLMQDMHFEYPGSLIGVGTIRGNHHALMLPRQDWLLFPVLPRRYDNYAFCMHDVTIVCQGNVKMTMPLCITGECTIDGGGNIFDMDEHPFMLDPGATLCIKNSVIRGSVFEAFVMDDTSTLIFDTVTLLLENDITFNRGIMHIEGMCTFVGTSAITYASEKPCMIHRHSCICVKNGATFVFDPQKYKQSGIDCVDATSVIHLVHASLQSEKPLLLTRGTLRLQGAVFLENGGTSCRDGIIIGDGKNMRNNMTICSDDSTTVTITRGYIVYNNV
ncbi:MAG TPA: hypothetical protein VEK38_03800 [Candidatus Bathyarchaeia archaeon]|nr:hypothetical protein [Candidatus Bathyarchaeia archaeon]